MFNSFRYWTFSRVLFVIFYIALNVGFFYCSWKVFITPRVSEEFIVLKKDSGISEAGIPKYFVEVSDVKDSKKTYREEISYGFVWDTIDVKEKITMQRIQYMTWIYAAIAFFLLFPIILFARDFSKLILRLV